MPAPAKFIRQVGHALAHLYDPEALRGHPLIVALGLEARPNPQEALRETLIAAVEALKPAPSAPSTSRTWRVYNLLQCRYVQQVDQEEAADQLGVSPRQVRREQQVAVRALADTLFLEHETQVTPPTVGGYETRSGVEDELSWLSATAGEGHAMLADSLQGALQLAAPLARSRHTHLHLDALPALPPLAIHPAGLKQAILSTTTWAIRRVSTGEICFSARQAGDAIVLMLETTARAQKPPSHEGDESLAVARTILAEFGGSIEVRRRLTSLSVTVTFPIVGVVDVLLVDDNEDLQQLFERYVSGTRYRIHGTRGAEPLFGLIADKAPAIILLDVMVPGMDGWDILARLRQHPLTARLPVIVCTILPEEDLALALGATAFLRKPVTRQALLATLSQVHGEAPRGRH